MVYRRFLGIQYLRSDLQEKAVEFNGGNVRQADRQIFTEHNGGDDIGRTRIITRLGERMVVDMAQYQGHKQITGKQPDSQ